jgi:hypothetical protein
VTIDHECSPSGYCEVCIFEQVPELHERRACTCVEGLTYEDGNGQPRQVLCSWCRVKNFKLANRPAHAETWTENIGASTLPEPLEDLDRW